MRPSAINDLKGGWRSYIHISFMGKLLAERLKYCLSCAAVVLLATACGGSTPATNLTEVQPTAAPSSAVNDINQSLSLMAAQSGDSTADYRLGPDDLLQMTIYNIPDQDARVTPRITLLRVSQEGIVVAPLVGTVQVKGKTIRQVEKQLSEQYAKYIKSPQIGVLVTEYRQRVSVMGAV